MSEEEVASVRRREAASGRVSYGDPLILHESSRTRVQIVPFYVSRSNGTDLSVKITTYQKAPPPNDWAVVEAKSVSFNEAAARALLRALQTHLAVAAQSEDGDFIVIRAREGTADFGSLDPVAVANAVTGVLGRPEIAAHLANANLSDELVVAFRGAIRLRELRSAVASLRNSLEQGEVREQVYQEWCQNHTWAFGNAYVLSDDARDITPGDRLDLLVPTVISGYRDIVELKRPDMAVLNWDGSHRNFYFSSEVSKAIGQVHRYLDAFQEVAANGLRDHPEIVAYHPRAILVIGRSQGWPPDQLRALHGLNSRLSGLTVMTYDQLLAQGERLVEILSSEQTEMFDDPIPDLTTFDADEDFPF